MLNNNKIQSGVSLYLALAIMAVLLSLALGISSIFLGQVKTAREMGRSVVAFYAADAGIENVLMARDNPADIPQTFLSNGAAYHAQVVLGGVGACPVSLSFCIKSTGTYKEIRRAIEVAY